MKEFLYSVGSMYDSSDQNTVKLFKQKNVAANLFLKQGVGRNTAFHCHIGNKNSIYCG